MLVTPGPIIWGSIALSNYARSDSARPPANNEVIPAQTNPQREPKVQFVAVADTVDETLAAACLARAAELRPALGEKCEILVAAPFVIGGDLSLAELTTWHRQTIAPAAAAMANRYFEKQPDRPITVLLFSTKESYEYYANHLYRDRGISIYGYYKPRERTLVMNISTGGGTLVHELTHALVAFDCPDVPDWFNEGLASLHEQCRFREDQRGPWIEGLVNWRLARLQQEFAAKRVPALVDFLQDDNFRGEREAVNYGQARYFCLFMQRRGVLEKYYSALRQNIDEDPRGLKAVAAVFPDRTWAELDAEFRQFVADLQASE
jgi:hypothetical protein